MNDSIHCPKTFMNEQKFQIQTTFSPCGDQGPAIDSLVKGISEEKKSQVLLGVTGSGKTFTMAQVIQRVQRPALILAHNKTLAAQLYQEFKAFFPLNAVEYFVSYYDYYQPEAYIARTDTYIEKDSSINDRIDQMRLSATRSLIERNDVIIISSVSCIYGLGLPEYYHKMALHLKISETKKRDEILLHLVDMHYKRNDFDLVRKAFRVKGDVLEIFPAYERDFGYRIEFLGNQVERISQIDPLTGKVQERLQEVTLYPGSHHVTPEEVREKAVESIRKELEERESFFEREKKFLEKQRIHERTLYDIEMIREMGTCKGIENYSRHFSHRKEGDPPACLLDYFPKNFLLFVDESHQTLPQIHAMYNGDRARKEVLVSFGFRLPSAMDQRPLKFEEVYERISQVIYVSATPGIWEIHEAMGAVVKQILRPTGLLDPMIELKPAQNQVEDVLEAIRVETEKGGRVLVTTLTKRLAEELSEYLNEMNISAKYLHADIDTLERIEIIKQLRLGEFDVLVGINLLREGLDLPEVSLVAVLDADKEGFLRSETSLIQICGRAARNEKGRVILYADKKTSAIENTIKISQERRAFQDAYNKEHGIIPYTTTRAKVEDLEETFGKVSAGKEEVKRVDFPSYSGKSLDKQIKLYEKKMKDAAKKMKFEEAARYRDLLYHYQNLKLLE